MHVTAVLPSFVIMLNKDPILFNTVSWIHPQLYLGPHPAHSTEQADPGAHVQ